jgi:hypothetical protein
MGLGRNAKKFCVVVSNDVRIFESAAVTGSGRQDNSLRKFHVGVCVRALEPAVFFVPIVMGVSREQRMVLL